MFLETWMLFVLALVTGLAYVHGYYRGRYIGFHFGMYHTIWKLDRFNFIKINADGKIKSGTVTEFKDATDYK